MVLGSPIHTENEKGPASHERRNFLKRTPVVVVVGATIAAKLFGACSVTSRRLEDKLMPEVLQSVKDAIEDYRRKYQPRMTVEMRDHEQYTLGAWPAGATALGSPGMIWLDTDNINKQDPQYIYDSVLYELTHAARPTTPSPLITKYMSLGPGRGVIYVCIGLSVNIENQGGSREWFSLFEQGAAEVMARAVKGSHTNRAEPQKKLGQLVNIGMKQDGYDVHAPFGMLQRSDVEEFVAMMIRKHPTGIKGRDIGDTMEIFQKVADGHLEPEGGHATLLQSTSQ